MVATTLADRPFRVPALRRLTWQRPETPWAFLAAGAWIVLALEEVRPAAQLQHSMRGMTMAPASHPHHYGLSVFGLAWWMLMTVAMMVPAALPLLREISLQSLWTRRYRSAALFLAGYLAVWGLFGVAALGFWHVVGFATPPAPGGLATSVTLFVGAAWGLTAAKRRHLKQCHRFLPLAPRGRAADVTCLRFGLYHGRECLAVCWPLMLAMVPAHTLAVMLGATAFITWERSARLPRLHGGALVLACAGALGVFLAA